MGSPDGAIKLLEKLRQESFEIIPSKGFFSKEFQRWHSTAVALLRKYFDEDDIIYKDFQQLQFEWPREILESMHASMVSFSKNPEKAIEESYKEAPAEFRRAAQKAMRQLIKSLSPKKRKQIADAGTALDAFEHELFAHSQKRRFLKAMEEADGILLAAISSLRNKKN